MTSTGPVAVRIRVSNHAGATVQVRLPCDNVLRSNEIDRLLGFSADCSDR
ncbi:hypothetical protein G3I60_20385 [Streptomyces sp. SID13666]|nr:MULTISPECIES: hypothetical protein [unclassified Streptomyces]NEA56438.1 hypothetical protein [Streptomyces sp. SID13666]NEA75850.1 hypothetical protein [Streptomyces sp. SID13588]